VLNMRHRTSIEQIPTDELRQCAWCQRVRDEDGSYSEEPQRRLRTATHGICPSCAREFRAEIDDQLPDQLVP
jgi:hypothetical protein